MKNIILIILISVTILNLTAQTKLKGIVTDINTKEPIAFANVVYNNKMGTTTGIDGKFIINSKIIIKNIEVSFIGYKTKIISISSLKNPLNIKIKLEPTAYNIDEVTIFPGINPAHRIINNVIDNKKINNPEKMTSFEYTSYNKMIFTINTDKIDTINYLDTTRVLSNTDSTNKAILKFKDEQHLMIIESVSNRKFQKPDKNNEKVIASRVSGLQDPSFTLLATQLQSLSFYKTYISVVDKRYLSPIANGSTKKYFFLIKDTIYNQQNDTIFIISYRPKKGKNFEGLKGVLHINSNKYAIQSVKAEPYDDNVSMGINIQQNYSYINNKQWFPTQLNTDIEFKTLGVQGGSTVVAIGKSYLKGVKLNPEFKKRTFNHIVQEIDVNAAKKNESFWNKYRQDTLSLKEENTYHVIDSIGKEADFDGMLNKYTSLFSGKIPIFKIISLDFTKVIDYNKFEGFQLGIGLETNNQLSRIFSVGGYTRYGFTDLQWKYGGHTQIVINKQHQIKLKLHYFNDVEESSGYFFQGKRYDIFGSGTSEVYRKYYIKDMYYTQGGTITLEHRLLRYLKAEYSIKHSVDEITNGYIFEEVKAENNNGLITSNNNIYTSNQAIIKLKYVYKEKFANSKYGFISLGSKFPKIYANITFGLNNFDGDYSYTKYEAMITKNFTIKNIGITHLATTAGYTNYNIPYIYLYNGKGSFSSFGIETDRAFNTMRMNEFLSDEFINVFFRHDFKGLLYKSKKFQPKLVAVTNIAFGNLKHNKGHKNITYKTLEKGYYESGILINNLFLTNITSIGFGVFYRYGPYTNIKVSDNFAYKISFYYSL